MSEDVFHYETTAITSGFVGECSEIPSVVVYGNTEQEVEGKMISALKGFENAFPEELAKINAEEEKIKHIPRALLTSG